MNQILNRFSGKTVIVTGASAGVGAACARAFANEGAKLVLVARGKEALQKISDELQSTTEVLSVAMDVGDNNACLDLITKAKERFGSIHVLVNNAGMHARGDVEHVEANDIAAMVDINLRAPLLLTAAALPHLMEAKTGAIVMVGSLAGRAPMQGAATYAATKAGLRAFTYGLADELTGSGIHIGVVSPGPIDTGFIMSEIDNVADIVFSQPMSSADSVAEAILQIASGQKLEICMPALSGRVTTLGYIFPALRRWLRPKLDAAGRKNKEKYREENR
ncbi:MAG: SDR family NAD(P)-dependent oxidoreductase [Halioglobus sp.]